MRIQCKPRASLLEVMESQVGGKAPEVVAQTKLPPLPTPHDPQQKIYDKKRKREQEGKEVVEERRGGLPKEMEPQKWAKVAKTGQKKSLGDGAPRDKG